MLRIVHLYAYPVKSCAGVSLPRLELDEKGPVHDRRWMIVDKNRRFLTQRDLPKLARFRPIWSDGSWLLQSPSGRQFPLTSEGTPTTIHIWKDEVAATDLGETAHQWLRQELGEDVRLVHAGRDFVRPIPEKFESRFARLSFVDSMPLLLISEETLADLNSRLPEAVEMSRFRPNIVIAGGHPYGEDLWMSVRTDDMVLRVAKGCSRCIITTIDQNTGESKGPEPLKTLATYRRQENKVMFGQYLIHEQPGFLQVGMPLQTHPI